jgi:hypothetical protein
MTKDASFKKVVRRHAEETGQRCTEALMDLEGLGARMNHEPAAERLLVHLRDRYGIDAVAATKLSVHKTYVFRPLIRARSTAHSFDIRRRSFCLLVATEDSTGKPVPLLVLRADPDEREALLSIGHPFFASRAGRDRIGVLLTDDIDWEEIRELATES